jgi:tetratricopeptide (TPR) repeat protein
MMIERKQRVKQLKTFLEENPRDTLALYALALEHRSAGNLDAARSCFQRLLEIDPDYVAAYYPMAQILLKQGRNAQAARILRAGIPRAVEAGHLHARDRLRELLATLAPDRAK